MASTSVSATVPNIKHFARLIKVRMVASDSINLTGITGDSPDGHIG